MKIAFLSRYQNQTSRGAEVFVKELASSLSRQNSVEILSGESSDSLAKIIGGKYQVVISMNGRLQSLKASFGRLFSKYKLVITGQSGIGRDDIWNIAVVKPDVYVGLTEYEANWAKKWAWGTKVVKIPNGVDLNKFTPFGKKKRFNLEKPIILSVGALSWYKHHERTIEAISQLKTGSLLVVGRGEEQGNLEALAQKKIPGRFKIINASFERIPEIYRSVDIFTLPSWNRESFGIVYAEAMASGLPVVAPNDPPRREIVGQAGILTNVENSWMFAQAIEQALKIKWGNKPRKQSEKFSWDKVADEYEKLFESLF